MSEREAVTRVMLVDDHAVVRAGERPVLSPDLAARSGDPVAMPPHFTLSAREFDVLHQLIEGRSIEQIAERLCLIVKTVFNYQTVVRQKLGVEGAVELLRYARQHGLLAD